MRIGAGSVVTVEQARTCLDSGAQFIVAPILREAVIRVCNDADIPVFPGAYTPTEIQTAWEMGADAVKVFPARELGPTYIKDVLAPLPHLRLVPTGGVNADNASAYRKAGAFTLGIGSNLVQRKDVETGNWQAITQRAKTFMGAWQQT